MGRWWDSQMASSSQALYMDPSLALDAANTPSEDLLAQSQPQYTKTQQDQDKEEKQSDPGWFGKVLGAVTNFGNKADDVLNSVTAGAWDPLQENVVKPLGKAAWYPVDKLATGAHWLYSNVVSRPLSTLLQMEAQAVLDADPAALLSADKWGQAYDAAENISPGQVVGNSFMTALTADNAAADVAGRVLDPFGNGGLADAQKTLRETTAGDPIRDRNTQRLIQDTGYWRDKGGWGYTMGTGALDFMAVMTLDPTTYLTAGVSSAVKGVRSVEYAEQAGKLVRDQGGVVNTAKKLAGKSPQTPEQVSGGKKMQDFFDWVASPSKVTGAERKSAKEIEAHPIFGRGRRAAPAKAQLAEVFAGTARADMPAMYRYSVGDQSALPELMATGGKAIDDIGRVSESRQLVNSTVLDPEMLAFFAAKAGAKGDVAAAKLPNLVASPEVMKLHEDAAKAVVSAKPQVRINASGGISKAFAKEADTWKAGQLNMINQELARTEGIGAVLRQALNSNIGKEADDFTTTIEGAHLFGSLPKSYRMGEGAFRSAETSANKKFASKMADRTGRFADQGVRKGFFGTPVRMLQAFGDKTPLGRVNHNDMDAGDRVYEMLREVPGLGIGNRANMMNRYITAGDKTAKSRVLDEIQTDVMNHLAQNVHGLHPEIANIFADMTRVGMENTVNRLSGKTVGSTKFGTKQAFSSAMKEGESKTVDHIEDGVGYAVSPLAKTQLAQTDSLLPIKEINRVLSRNSGALKTLTRMGAKPADAVRIIADNANTIWKGATLLRPAYTVRMVSEELAAAAIKFGFMSHIVGSGTKGSTNFVLNRGQYLGAEMGLTSYAPSTGKGVDSSLAVVKLGDEPEIAATVASRRAALQAELAATSDPLKISQLKGQLDAVKTTRIRVNKALPIIDARLTMERAAQGKVQQELARTEKKYAAIAQNMAKSQGPVGRRTEIALDQHQAKIDDLTARIQDHQDVIDEFAEYSNYVLNKAVASTGRRIGEKSNITYRGQTIHEPFSKKWTNPISRSQFDAEGEYAATAIYARATAVDKERMIASGSWDYITPDQPQHMGEWLNALNHQFGQDEVFRLVMEDPTGKKARAFLDTPAGKQHRKDIGGQGRDADKLVENVALTLDKYLPEHTGLRTKLLEGKDVTKADLEKAIPPQNFPVVHGQEVLDKTALWGKHQPGNIVDAAIKNGFNRLGAIPSSIMSRNPVYTKFYEGRIKEGIDQELRIRQAAGKSETLTPAELNDLHRHADRTARKDMSKIVYDPNRTTATEALRFIAPFFSAHADGLARWGGLIAEKPQALSRIAEIYNAPVAANMVTDTQGNLVGMDGYAEVRDPKTGKVLDRHFVPITDRVLQLKAPWADKNEGAFPIKIQAFNTILPGDPWWNPGSGPLVQVAGTALAKASPSTGDFLQWSKVLPYGPSGSMTEAVTPKYMRTLWDAYKGDDPDNEEYQKAYLQIWQKKVAEYNHGKAEFLKSHPGATAEELQKGMQEFTFGQKDIDREAKDFLYLNVLEAWGSPAQSSNSPLTGSPYQFYVDQLAQMRKLDPETGTERFLAEFGTDYAQFTASLSKSIGIASTISADQQAEKYKDQIAADPDMAAFWVGDVYNGGPFSSSVMAKQMDQNFGATKAREKITGEAAIENSQVSTGWSEYKKGKLYFDSLLIRNGFKSYSQKGAEQFNAARQQLVAGISAKYPAWGEAFSVTDRAKIPNRIKSFTAALNDEKLANDPMRRELPVLAEYLQGRQYFKQALAARGLSQVSFDVGGAPTGQAADIGYAWDQFRTGLANSNIAFNELMNRYLSNDDLQG